HRIVNIHALPAQHARHRLRRLFIQRARLLDHRLQHPCKRRIRTRLHRSGQTRKRIIDARCSNAAHQSEPIPKPVHTHPSSGIHYFKISSDELTMFFSACTADTFMPYDRVAPIRSTISVSGLMSGYSTYPSAPASGLPGSYRRNGALLSLMTPATATPP